MGGLKEEFKSRTKVDQFNTKKKEFYVFGLSLEIFKDQKDIHICVNKKELDKIYQRINYLSKKVCFRCVREDCFICNKFKFIYKQYVNYNDNEKNTMLWKIYSKTNQYEIELKHVI